MVITNLSSEPTVFSKVYFNHGYRAGKFTKKNPFPFTHCIAATFPTCILSQRRGAGDWKKTLEWEGLLQTFPRLRAPGCLRASLPVCVEGKQRPRPRQPENHETGVRESGDLKVEKDLQLLQKHGEDVITSHQQVDDSHNYKEGKKELDQVADTA